MPPEPRTPAENAVTLVGFSFSDPDYPFVAVADAGGAARLEEFVPRGEAEYGEFLTVAGIDPEAVLDLAAQHDPVEAELLAERETAGLFEFVVGPHCPAVSLCEQGAVPRRIESASGEGYIAAEVPPTEDASAIVDRFLDAHPDAELVIKRDQPYAAPVLGPRAFRHAAEEHLSDRQQEALATAHEAGYYEIPREADGPEVAEKLGVSSSTLHQHLRMAEQKLVALVFEDPATETPPDGPGRTTDNPAVGGPE